MTATEPTLPAQARTPDAAAFPSSVEYHRVLFNGQRRIGRGILAIVLLLVGFVLLAAGMNVATTMIDTQLLGRTGFTPLSQAGSMIALALLIPWSMFIQRWLYQVPGRSLHSVVSRLRFDVLGKALLWFGPVWLIVIVLGFAGPIEQSEWSPLDLLAFFIVTMLLTPLQAAGEEYGFRGLMFRVVGSWTRTARAGLILGVVVTSVLFTAIHGASDPYSIVWYLVLFAGLAIITWRTGGLETAIVLHAVLNTVTFLVSGLLRIDLGAALHTRPDGVGSPYQLVPTFVIAAITAIVWWSTRSNHAVTPGAS